MSDTKKLKLRVTGQSVISSWNKNGAEVTLYAIEAVDEDGKTPDLEFRSFQELAVDELVEYEARRYEHPEHGVSWTLKRPSSGLGAAVKELQTAVEVLTRRVAKLEARLGEPEPDVHPAQKDADHPRGPSLLPPVVDEQDEKYGKDAPW